MIRRYLWIILLLVAVPCYALNPFQAFMMSAGASGAAALSACPDATHASLLCEAMDGSTDCGNEATNDSTCNVGGWTVAGEGSGSSIDFTTTHSGTLNSNYKGSNAVTLTDGNASATGPTAYYRMGTNVTTNYVQFYFNVPTGITTNSKQINILEANASTTYGSNDAWKVYFYRVGATGCGGTAPGYKIGLFHNNGTTSINDFSDVTTLCANTWYGVRVFYKYNDANGISWAIDYDLDGTFTDQTSSSTQTAARYADYLWISSNTDAGNAENPVVQIDMIKIDATDYPGATAP